VRLIQGVVRLSHAKKAPLSKIDQRGSHMTKNHSANQDDPQLSWPQTRTRLQAVGLP
jgi:hypothetical protein